MKKWLTTGMVASLLSVPLSGAAADADDICIKPFETYLTQMVPQARKYPNQGWFYGFHVGITTMTAFNLDPEVENGSIVYGEFGITPNTGMMFGASLGYRYKHFRWEMELSFRENDLSDPTQFRYAQDGVTTIIQTHPDAGDSSAIHLMSNFYWDFTWGQYIMPFLGIGVGIGQYSYDLDFRRSNAFTYMDAMDPMDPQIVNGPIGAGFNISDSTVGFAFQFMAGIGWMISQSVELDVKYIYFLGGSTILTEKGILGAGMTQEVDLNTEYNQNSIVLELRIS